MSRRAAGLLAVLVVMAMLATAVTPAFAATPIPPKHGDQYVVGICWVSLQHPFNVIMQRYLEPEVKKQNVKLIQMDGQEDVGKQMSQIEDLIAQDVDLILVAAIDAKAMVAGVQKANEAKIPVAEFDREVAGGQYMTFVGGDNVAMGRMAANYIATRLSGKGNVAELEGAVGSSPAIDRGNGFHEVMDHYPNIKVVFKQTAAFERAKGMEVTENLIQSGIQFDAIYCHNDEMAGGAREALKAHKLLGKVILTGIDQQKDALNAINAGEMDADMLNPPQQAQMALVEGLKYLKGEPYSTRLLLSPELITKGNIDYYMPQSY